MINKNVPFATCYECYRRRLCARWKHRSTDVWLPVIFPWGFLNSSARSRASFEGVITAVGGYFLETRYLSRYLHENGKILLLEKATKEIERVRGEYLSVFILRLRVPRSNNVSPVITRSRILLILRTRHLETFSFSGSFFFNFDRMNRMLHRAQEAWK